LRRRERRDQVELLEDEADRSEPEVGEAVVVEVAEVDAVEQQLAGAGAVETAEQLQQRRLARAAWAGDDDELAAGNREIETA
jgi:hypothetical protein